MSKSVRGREYKANRRTEGSHGVHHSAGSRGKMECFTAAGTEILCAGENRRREKIRCFLGDTGECVETGRSAQKRKTGLRLPARRPKASSDLMPLMNTAFEPGRCMEYIRAMKDGPGKEIALAEYHYFSGQPELAAQEAELHLTDPDAARRLSACDLCVRTSVHRADPPRAVRVGGSDKCTADRRREHPAGNLCGTGVYRVGGGRSSASATARKPAADSGIHGPSAAGAARVCAVCASALYVSAGGVREEPRHCGGDPLR